MSFDVPKRRAPLAAWLPMLAVLILGAPSAAPAQSAGSGPSVHTDKGAVIGKTVGSTAQFLGIPYAAPPTGPLRFRAPQPREAWSTPLQATAFGSPCPQTPRLGSGSTNEDCLFLNVFAPAKSDGKRPVMVFIHGGSFNAGSGGVAPNGPDYTGTQIVEKGGVVVVTINYRLNILGFLAAPALDAENPKHVSGNYGLQDQQEALRWVKRNIAAFGGDPGNVTIFGESAGGISVLYHLVSPGAAGLFHRAIIESSNDAASVPLAAAEAVYAPIVTGLGCGGASDVAACLRALPVDKIVNSGLAAGPIQDGVTVPRQPREAIAAGAFNKVPVIMGTNRDEGTYFLSVATIVAGRAATEADYANTILANFGAAAAPKIEAAYPVAEYPSPGQALAAIQTDSFFACPTEATRAALVRHAPTWGYEFAKQNPVSNFPLPQGQGIALGDSHTTELAYVFGHDAKGAPLPAGPDRALSDAMIRYWTNLAASGDPNRAVSPHGHGKDEADGSPRQEGTRWSAYLASASRVLSLADPIRQEVDFADTHHCALWASLGYPQKLITALAPAP